MQHGYEIWKCLGQESVQRSVVGSGPWCLVSTSHAWQISTSFQPWRKGWRRSVVCWVVVSNICLFSSLFGEMIQFDQYSPDGLVQPPTRLNAYLRLRRWTILFGFKKFWSLSDSAEKVEFFPKKSPKRTGGKTSEVVVFLFQVCWRLWVHVGFGNLLLSFQWGFFTEIWEQVVGLPSFEVIVSFTPPKTNECPLKRDDFNRKYIFQPLIFRGHVSFPGGRSFWGHCRKKGGY